MIYYFSGTGNSKWVAEQIGKGSNQLVINIAEILKKGETHWHFEEGDVFGIVFPIYSWGLPAPVAGFLDGCTFEQGVYGFSVCTCGEEAGKTMKKLKKRFPISAAWSIVMPNNYIPMMDIDSPNEIVRKVDEARERIKIISATVLTKASKWEVNEGPFANLKSGIVYPMFIKMTKSTKNFWVQDTCTSCGLCEKVCPTGTIRMFDGRPEWNNNCAQCLSCINRCPVKAIQYGKGTVGRGRYTFEEFFKK